MNVIRSTYSNTSQPVGDPESSLLVKGNLCHLDGQTHGLSAHSSDDIFLFPDSFVDCLWVLDFGEVGRNFPLKETIFLPLDILRILGRQRDGGNIQNYDRRIKSNEEQVNG